MAKRIKLPQITEREKSAPAYRKKLEQENAQLRASLESTQNQASLLQENNALLKSQKLVNDERLKNQGLFTWTIFIEGLLVGPAIQFLLDKNFKSASYSLLPAVLLFIIYFIAPQLWEKFMKNKKGDNFK